MCSHAACASPCNSLESLQEDFLWELAVQPSSFHCYETFPDPLCVYSLGNTLTISCPAGIGPFTRFRWIPWHPQPGHLVTCLCHGSFGRLAQKFLFRPLSKKPFPKCWCCDEGSCWRMESRAQAANSVLLSCVFTPHKNRALRLYSSF